MQSDVYANYHVTERRRFYQGSAKWLLSPDPGSGQLTAAPLRSVGPDRSPETTRSRRHVDRRADATPTT